jgi:hypothetical protein
MPKGAALILEGGFDPNGQFYFLPIHDTARLAQLLRQRTIGLFLKLGLITEQFSETLLCWRHSGFSVDNSVRLDGSDHTARQALAQYIARAPLSLQKLTYDRAGGKVRYHTSFNPYFKQNTSLWSAPDFIAHLTQFIPPGGVRYIHYYGLYSSRCKARWPRLPYIARVAPQGWRQSHAEPMTPHAEASEPTTVSHAACRSAWAKLIAKVYEIDLSGGNWPRSGQREPLALSPVWLRDATHRGYHRPRGGTHDSAPPAQDRQGAAGTRCERAELNLSSTLVILMNAFLRAARRVSRIPCSTSSLHLERLTAVSLGGRHLVEAARRGCSRQVAPQPP